MSVMKVEAAKMVDRSPVLQGSKLPYYLVLLYLFLEFGRPQESIPGLGALRLSAIVVVILMTALAFSRKAIFIDKQTKLFALLLALMAIHTPLALNNYWAFYITEGMFITFVAYLSIIIFVDSLERFKALMSVWLGIHLYLAITGIMHGGRGIGGFLGDENDFCMVLNMVIPFAFFTALGDTGKLKKAISIGLLLFFLFANMLTLSRGGFIGLAAVGVYCWFRSPRKIVSAALIGFLILFMIQYAPDTYWKEVKSIQQEGASEGTGEERVYQWKIGWKMFLDNRIFGVGQGNFPFQFAKYEEASGFQEGLHGRSRAGRAAHSLYFTLLPELGIVGALIYLGMIYHVYKDTRFIRQSSLKKLTGLPVEEKKKIFYFAHAMEGSLIGFFVSGIFISVLYYPSFWILMGFIVALRKVVSTNYENNSPSH